MAKPKYDPSSVHLVGHLDHEDDGERSQLESTLGHWFEWQQEHQWPRALQAFENASYLAGNHLTRFFYDSNGFDSFTLGVHDRTGFDHFVAKCADNRLIRPVEEVCSMLTSSKPMPRMEPNSATPADEAAARISELFTQLTFERPLNMPMRREEIAMIGIITGTSITEAKYEEIDLPLEVQGYKIEKRKIPPEEKLLDDDPDFEEVEVPAGTEVIQRKDFRCDVWTPFHFYPDPLATHEDEMIWCVRHGFEDIDWIRENFDKKDVPGYYPENLDRIQYEHAGRNPLYWWLRINDIIDSPNSMHQGSGMSPRAFETEQGANQTLLSYVDVKPTSSYPQGRTIILAGGKIIYCGPNRAWSEKYPWRWHKYSFWRWFRIPGRFWGIAALSEIVPLQKKINAIDALIHANREYMSLGQWWIPTHCKVAEGSISGIPGIQHTYRAIPGLPGPERATHEPLPPELMQEKFQLIDAIGWIMGTGQSSGDNISGSALRAGDMLTFLQQEKLRSKALMIQRFEQCLEGVAQNALIDCQLALEQEDPELTQRMQVAAREESSLTIRAFTGESLRDHHAIKIDISSEIQNSPEAMQQKATQFMQAAGQMLTPNQLETLWKVMGFDKLAPSVGNASMERARRMVARIEAGESLESVFPMPEIEDPAMMLPEFQKALLSDRVVDMAPEARAALMQMHDTYKGMVEAQMQAALERQMAMQESPAKAA